MPSISFEKLDTNPHDPILNNIVGSWIFNPTESRVPARIKRHLEEGDMYLTIEDEKLVGAIAFSLSDSGEVEITGLGVLEDLRARGLGRAIIELAAKELFCSQVIYVETDDSAVRFYGRCGFSIVQTKTLENGIIRYTLRKESGRTS